MRYFVAVDAGGVERFRAGGTIELRTVTPFAPSYRHAGKRNSELQARWQKLLLFTQKQADCSDYRMYPCLQLRVKNLS